MKTYNYSFLRGLAAGALTIIMIVAAMTFWPRGSASQRPAPGSLEEYQRYAAEHPKPGTTGQYQLHSVSYHVFMTNKLVEVKELWRIDTASGKTWSLAPGNIEKGLIGAQWQPVKEFLPTPPNK